MKRGVGLLLAVLFLGAAACTGSSGDDRLVRVDYQHDEFASHYWRYFPSTIYAHAGDTVVFRQEWTGEPHTVTFGRQLDELEGELAELEAAYADRTDPEAEEEGFAEYRRLTRGTVFDPYLDADSPRAAKPCYLESGEPPRDPDEACARTEQPRFSGNQSYYSSGFIPPSGATGNTYRMPLTESIRPGTYNFHCIIHFGAMRGTLVVRPESESLPTAREASRTALDEIEVLAKPLREAYADMRAGRANTAGQVLRGPLGGYHSHDEFTVGIDEFVPKRLRAIVDEPVTWTITGAHTVSFDVPRYVPIYVVGDDGTVDRNPVVDGAAGGSPVPPPADFSSGPIEIDGGTWDGSGFISSGLLAGEPISKYTLRVSEPGIYRFACLIHPKMVGTLEVEV